MQFSIEHIDLQNTQVLKFLFLSLKDENRYNAGRGAHLTLKRAEKARALVNKLPGIVESCLSALFLHPSVVKS